MKRGFPIVVTFFPCKDERFVLQANPEGVPQVDLAPVAIQVGVLLQHVLGNGLPARTRSTMTEISLYLEEPLGLPISVMASLINWRYGGREGAAFMGLSSVSLMVVENLKQPVI